MSCINDTDVSSQYNITNRTDDGPFRMRTLNDIDPPEPVNGKGVLIGNETHSERTLSAVHFDTNRKKEKVEEWERLKDMDFNKNCVFIDEAGLNLHTQRNFGRSIKDTPEKATVPTSKGASIAILGAISDAGVIDVSLRKPTATSTKKRRADNKYNMADHYLVMDNAPIHTPSAIRQLVESRGYKCAYLPPCSLFLNPISASDYTEMNEEIASILNIDWRRRPWMRIICARAMEEMILVEGRKVLVICHAEVYSRYPTLDAQYERSTNNSLQSIISTIPQFNSCYGSIQAFLTRADESMKLQIGTRTMSALVTGSIRADSDRPASIGPSCANGFAPTADSAIFLPRSFVEWFTMQKQEEIANLNRLYSSDELGQLRQLRSKFDQQSTYLMNRASAPCVNDLRSKPVTIWTLADHPSKTTQDTDTRVASRVFQGLAEAVWNDGDIATIDRSYLEGLFKLCKPEKDVAKILSAILSSESEPHISIICNSSLNRHLVKLADKLPNAIALANIHVARFVYQKYTS